MSNNNITDDSIKNMTKMQILNIGYNNNITN